MRSAEQLRRRLGLAHADVAERVRGGAAPARGAQQEAALEQVGLVDVLDRVRLLVDGDGSIDAATAYTALDAMGVDAEGLDRLDREILTAICERFGGGPVGLSTLAVAVQEESDTIEDVYEPYLLQRGFLQRTPRGRCTTPHAFRHLGLRPPESSPQLFG